ncbi:hypothetical protein Q7P37_008544 [Cladosporium fusiforme]
MEVDPRTDHFHLTLRSPNLELHIHPSSSKQAARQRRRETHHHHHPQQQQPAQTTTMASKLLTPLLRLPTALRFSPLPSTTALLRRTFTTTPTLSATYNQVLRGCRVEQRARKPTSPALVDRPEMKGVCVRVGTTKPKKPNSGERKVARVRLSSGRVITAYIPGEGHNVQQHSVVLVRGGRSQDCPGVKYHLVRGAFDLGGVGNRVTARSKYGASNKGESSRRYSANTVGNTDSPADEVYRSIEFMTSQALPYFFSCTTALGRHALLPRVSHSAYVSLEKQYYREYLKAFRFRTSTVGLPCADMTSDSDHRAPLDERPDATVRSPPMNNATEKLPLLLDRRYRLLVLLLIVVSVLVPMISIVTTTIHEVERNQHRDGPVTSLERYSSSVIVSRLAALDTTSSSKYSYDASSGTPRTTSSITASEHSLPTGTHNIAPNYEHRHDTQCTTSSPEQYDDTRSSVSSLVLNIYVQMVTCIAALLILCGSNLLLLHWSLNPRAERDVRWICTCGKRIRDDYTELRPDGSNNLQSRLDASLLELYRSGLERSVFGRIYKSTFPTPPRVRELLTNDRQQQRDNTKTSAGNFWAALKFILRGSKAEDDSLPQHNPASGPSRKDDSTKSRTPQITSKPQYLLLCIPHNQHSNELLQIDVSSPPSSDIDFFLLLRRIYVERRGRIRLLLSLQKVVEIRFVSFELYCNDLAEVKEYDCIPPETQEDQYVYKPMPAKSKIPVGPYVMKHLFDHPDHAYSRPIYFPKIPRKLNHRLSVRAAAGYNEGWGLYYVEKVSWSQVCCLGLVGVLACTIFGVAWTVLKDDIQGGFGVASYMLAVIVLGLGALQGAFEA